MTEKSAPADLSDAEARWVHSLFAPLALDRNGPFLVLPDDRLLTVDDQNLLASADDGQTWEVVAPAAFGQDPTEPASCYLLRAASGVLVMVYLDLAHQVFNWDDEAGEPQGDYRSELWAARSLDEGQTWVDRQRILDGYNGNFLGLIQIRDGRLVAVTEHLVTQPAHWVACSLISDDEGQTWRRSNLIDLGGHGHHDGALEPTVAELSDGRLLMLIRTNLDRFWQAFSDEGGRYWRTFGPSELDASTAPGHLLRLRSGRLVLVWNRLTPEGRPWPQGPVGPTMEAPASHHREELSIALSEDDGRSWTRPLVLARQPGGQLGYPFLLERRPGELWVLAAWAYRGDQPDPFPPRLKVDEEALMRAVSA